MKRPCRGCGVLMNVQPREGRRREWCSEACRHRHRYPRRRATCAWCGIAFETARVNRRYCSSECGWRYRAAITAPSWRDGECVACGASYRTKQPAQIYCGYECREDGRRSRRRGRKFQRRVQKPVRQRVLARDSWTCYLCQRPIRRDLVWPHPLSASVDHVIPVSAGGSDDLSNLRATHWHCNAEKGDRLLGVEMGFTMEAV